MLKKSDHDTYNWLDDPFDEQKIAEDDEQLRRGIASGRSCFIALVIFLCVVIIFICVFCFGLMFLTVLARS